MPSKDFVAFDPLAILTSLADVAYIVVDGFAAVLYGAPTVTRDLDIMPRADEENVHRLAAALADCVPSFGNRDPPGDGSRLLSSC